MPNLSEASYNTIDCFLKVKSLLILTPSPFWFEELGNLGLLVYFYTFYTISACVLITTKQNNIFWIFNDHLNSWKKTTKI